MPNNQRRIKRRSIRLNGHDTSQAGAYFITIVTHKRECFLGDVVDDNMVLSIYGTVAFREWFKSSEIRQEIELHENEFVIIPNHVHGIVWIVHGDSKLDVGSTSLSLPVTDFPGLGVRAHGRAPLRDQQEFKTRSLSKPLRSYTMKLYFLRHGRADRSAWMGVDFERPLTKKGKKRMAQEADFIAQLDLGLDTILTSPLVRSYQTAEIVAERLSMLDHLEMEDRLEPGFGPGDLSEILEEYSQADEIMFVGHEPDFSEIISYLIGGGNIVCKKGSFARVDLVDAGSLAGELVWLIPPKALVL